MVVKMPTVSAFRLPQILESKLKIEGFSGNT